jgi:hypothetical protein
MIRFAAWSQARSDSEDLTGKCNDQLSQSDSISVVQAELNGLLDGIIESLRIAAVVQLRATVKLAGKSWSEQQSIKNKQLVEVEFSRVEACIMDAVADALLPVLTELKLREVMKQFSTTLHQILPEFRSKEIVINAPDEVHGLLHEALTQNAIDAEIVSVKDYRISTHCESVALTANLHNWCQNLKSFALA